MRSVDLRRADIFMVKQMLNGIDVCTKFELQRGIRMAETVEGDMLIDAALLQPALHHPIRHSTFETLEDICSVGLWMD